MRAVGPSQSERDRHRSVQSTDVLWVNSATARHLAPVGISDPKGTPFPPQTNLRCSIRSKSGIVASQQRGAANTYVFLQFFFLCSDFWRNLRSFPVFSSPLFCPLGDVWTFVGNDFGLQKIPHFGPAFCFLDHDGFDFFLAPRTHPQSE